MSIKKKPKWTQEKVGDTTFVRSGANGNPRMKVLICTPTLGIVRMEWAATRYGQVIPCNWSSHDTTVGIGYTVPMHYLVADGQNIGVEHCVQGGFEWLLLWEDDVIPPLDLFTRLDNYMQKATIPIVSGLYFTKGLLSEPIVYCGRGTRYFGDFKIGDKFWVDGVPTGMLLIHRKILEIMYAESEPYKTLGGKMARKVFETPSKVIKDSTTGNWDRLQGTSDLWWCTRVMKEKVIRRAGWSRIAEKKHPFLVDSNIFCQHIDLSTGQQYPHAEILRRYQRR